MTVKTIGVNPELVPKKTLANGSVIPAIGLGTFGSDNYGPQEIADAVRFAIKAGYRHIDCAAVYANEKEIGTALKHVMDEGIVKREELWITSKVWNDMHGEGEVIASCKKSLSDLQLDYFDLYLVHWPFPNYHAPGCDVDARSPDSKPYIHEEYMVVWRQMEELYEKGLVKNIGTSNMTKPKMELLLRDAKIKPVVEEMELHPHMQQTDYFKYVVSKDIQPIGYSPIGSPKRPERDKTAEDTVDIEDPAVVEAAERLGVHPAVVCLKWAVQNGHIPIPFSVKQEKILSNLEAVVKDPLTDEEMEALSKIDKDCRLVKGHVFLWEGANDWKDLWDLDGTITK